MTFLQRRFFDPFTGIDDFFNTPTFTRRLTIDHNILGDKENYSIWELPNETFEVRVQYSDDDATYHRASNKPTMKEAEEYIEEQVKYHKRRAEGPKLVKSFKKH